MKKRAYRIRGPESVSLALHEINALPHDGSWQVAIEPYQRVRSVAQNALYWAWITIIADEVGYLDKDDVHEELAERFLPAISYLGLDGSARTRRPSTSDLSVMDFADYLGKVEAFAGSDLGITLPHPEDYEWAMKAA